MTEESEVWSESVGERGYTVWVGERLSKGRVVYLRWGKPAQYAVTAIRTVRDARGRVLARKVASAVKEAEGKVEELKGLRPARAAIGPMTLARGVELAFSARGPYPMDPKEDKWTRDARRYVDLAVSLLGGPETRWEEVTPGMIRAVWRKLETKGAHHDKATKTLVVFFRVADWLAGEFQDQRFPRAPHRWRQELKEHWTKRGHETEPHRPAHSEEEIALLFKHWRKADPRIRLGFAVGAELRGGQVMRALRSGFDRDGGKPMKRGHLGRLTFPQKSRRKRIPPRTLNWRERLAVERAIRVGYLSDLEAAYQRGEIPDYPLFPAGRLRKGKAVVRSRLAPIHPDTLAGQFHDFERAAGVTPVPGRAWHGLRRGFSNYYARLVKEGRVRDPRVLNEVQGWIKGSQMREKVYQEQEDEELRADAADLRLLRPQPKDDGSAV